MKKKFISNSWEGVSVVEINKFFTNKKTLTEEFYETYYGIDQTQCIFN